MRHRDHGMALWSAAGAAVAILICCAFWIGTGWPDGASAPMMAAVACSFFAAQDDPARCIRSFGLWSLVAIIVVAIYLFALVPAISHVEVLIVALAPTFLLYGFLIARPATAGIGMALAANTATLLALQSTYSADFASYANSAVAFFVGIADRRARDADRARRRRRVDRQSPGASSWTTLAVAAERRGKRDRAEFAGLMLHRLGLLVQRIAFLSESDRRDADSLVAAPHRPQHHRPAPRASWACGVDHCRHRRHARPARHRLPQPCRRRNAARTADQRRPGAGPGGEGSQ